jgi:acyl-coenzyme A thioesterase PaaI-like protein
VNEHAGTKHHHIAQIMRKTSRGVDWPGADAYAYLMASHRRYLDALAFARLEPEQIEALRISIDRLTEQLDGLAVPEEQRIYGVGRRDPGRVQVTTPAIVPLELSPTQFRGTVNIGEFFIGMNGAVHGGVITMVFDQVLGELATSGDRPPSRTAYLTTNFRAITPLNADLEIEAEIDRIEGRKRFVTGRLTHRGALCADAQALFVELKPGQL